MRRAILWMGLEEWKQKQDKDEAFVSKAYGIQKICTDTQVKAVSDEDRTIRFVISNQSVDRDRDTLAVGGWKLDSFLRNPVVPFAHDYQSLPVAKAIEIGPKGNALVSTAKFVPGDVYPFAETVYRMLQQGFLNAVSVGFRPLKHESNKSRGGVDFLEQELLEYSIVPVPANPEALIEARAAGIDVAPLKDWAEQVLDEMAGEVLISVPKAAIEALAKTLAPPSIPVTETVSSSETLVVDAKLEEPETKTETETTEVAPTEADEATKEIEQALSGSGEVAEASAIATTTEPESATAQVETNEPAEDGCEDHKAVDESFTKLDSIVLRTALPESFQWITNQLAEKAGSLLTRSGLDFRENGMDNIVPIATYPNRFVFGVVGMDRPFSEDPVYEASYGKDSRLGQMPRFRGEPKKVDIEVTISMVDAETRSADLKQPEFLPQVTKHTTPSTKQPVEGLVSFLDTEEWDANFQDCLGGAVASVMQQEVRESVERAVRLMRGRVD